MKLDTFEKPETLLRQIANCDDQLAHMPDVDPEWLDVDTWKSSCGTWRCWFGDFLLRRHGEDRLLEFVDEYWRLPSGGECASHVYSNIHYEFGSGLALYETVFTNRGVSTAARKAALQAHRHTLQAQVDAWYQAREVAA